MFDESEIDISHIVTCLYKLSITIQNPASQHRVENFSKISMEIHRGLDTQHISDKFPLAADYLVQRLANANIMRRQFLEYYKKNYEKIKGNDKSNTDGTEAERIPEVQETPAEDTHLVPEPNAQTGPFIPDTATRQSILDASKSKDGTHITGKTKTTVSTVYPQNYNTQTRRHYPRQSWRFA